MCLLVTLFRSQVMCKLKVAEKMKLFKESRCEVTKSIISLERTQEEHELGSVDFEAKEGSPHI